MEAAAYKKYHKTSASGVLLYIVKWFLLIFFAVYALFPLIWLAITSFKTNGELMANPFSLPAVWQIQNYINAIELSGIGRMMINSVVVSACAMVCNVVVAAMIAYCISRFEFKGKEGIFAMFSAGILVPLNALMIPYFVIINKLGLYDKIGGLILVYTAIGIPISTFIIRGFMNSLPKEIEEAAYIDGCGFFGRFFRIIFPLSRTGIVTAGILHFITCWNEFVYANLIISSSSNKTIQLGIRYFTNQFTTDYVSMYAAIIISIVPCIVAYVCFQEQIVSGLTSGAVKG
ncbi:MAG: carbohydrate ABC transporter permease [Angelakisella sp.]|nr:carbohydrate ABC transporter permease [Angelakisella sp.]